MISFSNKNVMFEKHLCTHKCELHVLYIWSLHASKMDTAVIKFKTNKNSNQKSVITESNSEYVIKKKQMHHKIKSTKDLMLGSKGRQCKECHTVVFRAIFIVHKFTYYVCESVSGAKQALHFGKLVSIY